MRTSYRIASFLVVLVGVGNGRGQSSQPAAPRDYGPLTAAIISQPLDRTREMLQERLRSNPAEDDSRLALAVVRLLQATERFGQSMYRYGFEPAPSVEMLTWVGLPNLRIPFPSNENPETIRYEDLRRILQQLIDDLADVSGALAPIRANDVHLWLPIGLVRLDFNRDGVLEEEEELWRPFARVVNLRNVRRDDALGFVVRLDRADVEWLAGYTHLLRAILECVLAYDFRELFERAGHLAFIKTESPYPFLLRRSRRGDQEQFLDLIAAIHLLNFKLREPARLRDAHRHLHQMVAHSRAMWKFVLAETDDEHELIPAPGQHGVIPRVQFTREQVDAWERVLQEFEAILDGKKLVPFWRNDPRGVDVRMVFLEPRDIDLVMWVQGTDAAPFLKHGEKTWPATWAEFQRMFGGQFFAYAALVN